MTCPILGPLPSLSAAGWEAKQAFALIWDSHPSVPMFPVGKPKPSGCLDAVGTGAIGELKKPTDQQTYGPAPALN